ncbi:MAG: hypothetical protein WBH82_03575 [Arcanobacterium sp.]
MKIAVVAQALAGCGPDEVGAIFQREWLARRPQDDVEVQLGSDGVLVDDVGTGLDVVFRSRYPDSVEMVRERPERAVHYDVSAKVGMIDLACNRTWPQVEQANEMVGGWVDHAVPPHGSSAYLAEDIRELIERGARRIHLHLPRLFADSDLGWGFLAELSGIAVGQQSTVGDLRAVLSAARQRLLTCRIDVTYAGDLSLSGVNGMARAWASAGMDPLHAQEAEKDIGAWSALMVKASQNEENTLLARPQVDVRSVYTGVGGGLAYVLAVLGAGIFHVGSYIPHAYWPEGDSEAELFVYVTDTIGLEVPAGLNEMVARAEELAAPAVLLTRYDQVRRGDARRLGLDGHYQLLNRLGTAAQDNSPINIPQQLAQTVQKLAQTWGWD